MKLAARLFGKAVVLALATSACGGADQDLFPNDLPEAGLGDESDASMDAAPDAPSDVSVTCETADDCPAPAKLCEISVCVRGLCSTAAAPAGVIVDESDQVPGDCRRLECGEAGALVVKADPDDVPLDDGNVCTVKRCEGSQPAIIPVEMGTPCGDGGVCNGEGECGECRPGDQSCDGNVPRTCDAEGVWERGQPCPFACDASTGSCTGVCQPGAVECSGSSLRTCDAMGQWQTTSCPNACVSGQCVGVCQPGAQQCLGNVPRECDANGQWQSRTPCPYACSGGVCVGSCVPGEKRCNGSVPQTCNSVGQWQNGSSCSYLCTDGNCTGVCAPGARRCSGTTTQLCDQLGQWRDDVECPFSCSAGSCTGQCTPGSRQCNGNVPQTCSASYTWVSGTACTNACVDGDCTGACSPGAKRCSGTTSQVCDANGEWRDDVVCPFFCSGSGQCTGVCTPGTKGCLGKAPQLCDAEGQWVANGGTCSVQCALGSCVNYPSSCNAASGAGLSTCGVDGSESCCADVLIPGGTFYRGSDGVSSTDTSLPATVSDFRLDKYEVTVARFRLFVNAVLGGFVPPVGSGKHAHLHGGGGLNGGTEAGWRSAWNVHLSSSRSVWDSQLACAAGSAWTSSAGANEDRPITCVNWYQAQAFCIWDGGFLPSEAEWHYAASGGDEQRFLPWSVPPTSTDLDTSRASFACLGDGTAACTVADLLRPGTKPYGRAKWEHFDMSGNASEWVLDLFGDYPPAPCIDCAALTDGARVIRGGSWRDEDVCSLRSAERRGWGAQSRSDAIGFRCARKP